MRGTRRDMGLVFECTPWMLGFGREGRPQPSL